MQKIDATNWTQLVEQLNQNFSAIYSLPVFKGLPGNTGSQGSPGPSGTRGSMWTYLDVDALNTSFATNYNPEDIDNTVIQTLITANAQDFISATTLTTIIAGDMLVAPDGKIYSWSVANSTFEYTGIDLVTPDDAISMQQALTLIQSNSLSASSSQKIYSAHHKKYRDASANAPLNSQTIFADSILDTHTQTSVAGVPEAQSVFIGLKEGLGIASAQRQKLTHVSGHMEDVHDLIQNSLVNTVQETVDDATHITPTKQPGHIILQNDRLTGLALGLRTDTSISKFGTIAMIAENVMMLSSQFGNVPHSNRLVLGETIGGDPELYSSIYGERVNIEASDKVRLVANGVTAGRVLEVDANNLLAATRLVADTAVAGNATLPGAASNITIATTNVIQAYVLARTWRMNQIAYSSRFYAEIYYDWTESAQISQITGGVETGLSLGGFNKPLPDASDVPQVITNATTNLVLGAKQYLVTRVVAPSLGRLMRRVRAARYYQYNDIAGMGVPSFDDPNAVGTGINALTQDFGGVAGVFIKPFVIDSFCSEFPFDGSCIQHQQPGN